jgi:hypothetical protein
VTRQTPDLLTTVDTMIAIHDAWVADEQSGRTNIPPEQLENAFAAMFSAAHDSDIPNGQKALFKYIEAFESQWEQYVNGQCKTNMEPYPRFWDALRAVIHERTLSASISSSPRRIESVATLRRQKVSDWQIANTIYGYHGKGPFLDDRGRMLPDLIDKEEKEPGSVVGADWVHPMEEQVRRDHLQQAETRIQKLEKLSREPERPRESVDGMLREGANIQQICKVCGVSEEQVLKVAEVLGITPKFRENIASMRAPHEPAIDEAAAQALSIDTRQAARTPQPRVTESIDKGPGQEKTAGMEKSGKRDPEISDETRKHVIELAEGNPDLGAAEIAAEVGKIKPHKVAQILEEHRKATAGAKA